MRIGIDLQSCNTTYSGGVATFAVGLAKGLARAKSKDDSVVIVSSTDNDDYLRSLFIGFEVSFLKLSHSKFYFYNISILKYIGAVIRNFKLSNYFERVFPSTEVRSIESSVDCLVVPTTTLRYSALNIPTILCIHDIQQEYFPGFFSLRERLFRWTSYRLSCWAATSVQVSSDYIKSCLLDKFQFMRAEKIFVSYEGVDFERFSFLQNAVPPNICNPLKANGFLFYPAQIWQHKNHSMLLEALSLFKVKHGYELPCVLTGQDGGYWAVLQDKIKSKKLNEVHYLGRVAFEQLLWLYQNSKAVLALGLHESSSLPVREGAVFGRPIICSNIPPNVEVSKYLCVRLVDCNHPNELCEAFEHLDVQVPSINVEAYNNIKSVKMFNWELLSNDYFHIMKNWR